MTTPRLEREIVFKKGEFPLSVHIWDEHPDYPLHVNEFSLIVIVLSGSGTHLIDNHRLTLRSGDVFVLHGNRPHGFRETHGLSLVNVIFDRRILKIHDLNIRDLPGYKQLFEIEPCLISNGVFERHLRLNIQQLTKIRSITNTIDNELNASHMKRKAIEYDKRLESPPPGHNPIDAGSDLIAFGHFLVLVGVLSRWYANEPVIDPRKLHEIAKAVHHMENNFDQQIDVGELSGFCNMSRRNFFRRFKEVTGKSPISYLSDLRLSYGAHLLQNSDKSITEIAFDCGFSDSNYFSKQFSKRIGKSPSEYKAITNA